MFFVYKSEIQNYKNFVRYSIEEEDFVKLEKILEDKWSRNESFLKWSRNESFLTPEDLASVENLRAYSKDMDTSNYYYTLEEICSTIEG